MIKFVRQNFNREYLKRAIYCTKKIDYKFD